MQESLQDQLRQERVLEESSENPLRGRVLVEDDNYDVLLNLRFL
jgi:hypothetical protein